MRPIVLLATLTACAPHREAGMVEPDAVEPDAAGERVRPVTRVLVGTRGVWWTYGTEACSLEFGCFYGGPTVSFWENQVDHSWVVDDSGAGAMTIAGDDEEQFIVTGTTHDERYVKRLGGPALSIPRPYTRGPAVDATYVYWADQASSGGSYTLHRAVRSGDGSDAVSLAMTIPALAQLEVFAGYVWLRDQNYWLTRVPVTGGAIEPVLEDVSTMTVAQSEVIVQRTSWTTNEIGAVDTSGAYRTIASLAGVQGAEFLVADAVDVYWSTTQQNAGAIFKAPLAGGITEKVTDTQHGGAIAITADRVLYNFTPDGFTTLAR